MLKRLSVLSFVLVLFVFVQIQPATAKEMWKMPLGIPTQLPGIGDGFITLARTIEDVTGGEVKIKLFEPGELVPAFAILDAVKENKVKAGVHVMAYSQGKIPATSLLMSVPFGLDPMGYAGWYYNGGGKELTQGLMDKQNVHAILCLLIGQEAGGWHREPLKSVDDLKGIKFRALGAAASVYKEVGASVTTLPIGETFQALEKGAIDAMEGSVLSVDMAIGINKVAKNVYYPGWQAPMGAGHLVINKKTWDNLSETTQAQIEASCTASVLRHLVSSQVTQAKMLVKARAQGINVHTFSPPMMDAFKAATKSLMAKKSAEDADFKEIYESMEAYKAKMADLNELTRIN